MTASADGAGRPPARRVAVVGMSTTPICGVHDHATLLAQALAEQGTSCTMHWLQRRANTLRAERREIRSWASELTDELAREEPDALLLHYSVFAHSHRGIPVHVPAMLDPLKSSRAPLISFLHEFVFPWGRDGVRGTAWALSDRAVMVGVMRASAGAVVTVEDRAGWLVSRPWLPRRPVVTAPVFATLPPPAGRGALEHEGPLLGLFGYSCRRSVVDVVSEALALVRARGVPARLVLLGAPGPDSGVGEMWRASAAARSLSDAVAFSGSLDAQDLSNTLAGCDLLLFADRPGPTSRKTTLAGSLASGAPVLAIDGPHTWGRLTEAGAVELAAPRGAALAEAIERLLADPRARAALGARGRAFAAEEMGVHRSAEIVSALLEAVIARGGEHRAGAPRELAAHDSHRARAAR